MKKSKIKILRINRKKHATITKIKEGEYAVYFDFLKIPIHMDLAYLSNLLKNNQIIVKSGLRMNDSASSSLNFTQAV